MVPQGTDPIWGTHDGDSTESRSTALRPADDSDAIRAEILTSYDVSMSQQIAYLLLHVLRHCFDYTFLASTISNQN